MTSDQKETTKRWDETLSADWKEMTEEAQRLNLAKVMELLKRSNKETERHAKWTCPVHNDCYREIQARWDFLPIIGIPHWLAHKTRLRLQYNHAGNDGQRVVAVDFDGVLHPYHGWNGARADGGTPIPGAREALAIMRTQGYKVVVFSARSPRQIRKWLREYGLLQYVHKVTRQKPVAEVYFDDRARHVPTNAPEGLLTAFRTYMVQRHNPFLEEVRKDNEALRAHMRDLGREEAHAIARQLSTLAGQSTDDVMVTAYIDRVYDYAARPGGFREWQQSQQSQQSQRPVQHDHVKCAPNACCAFSRDACVNGCNDTTPKQHTIPQDQARDRWSVP